MPERAPHTWGGPEWQEYCEQLLILRHPNSFARMPDEDGGDLGLEGYSLDSPCCAYQCYVPEAQETTKRAKDQNRKIARDLKKLVDKAVIVEQELKGIVIERWILLTPIHDSRQVTAQARKKELEMRGLGLPFIAADFRIDIQTVDTHFRQERALLDLGAAGLIKAPRIEITTQHLDDLARDAPDLLRNLDDKMSRLMAHAPDGKRRGMRDAMQKAAVDVANLEDYLRVNHPPVYESYLREREAEERDVELESYTGASGDSPYVTTARQRFEQRLREHVAGLARGDEATRLSHGAVADWLRRCPMDFPPAHEEAGR